MRITELVTEARLTPRDFYRLDRLNNLIKRLELGKPFVDDTTEEPIVIKASPEEIEQLKNVRLAFGDKEVITKDAISKLMPNTIGGVALSTLFKDGGLGGRGGSKGSGIVDDALANVGPAVETWKAIALFAKLTNRSNNIITMDDLMAVKDSLASQVTRERKKKSKVETAVVRQLLSVPDYNGKVNDTISIKIDVGLGSFQRAVAATPDDMALWGRIQGILRFVNENPALTRYNRIFASNGRVDPIKIAVVGGKGEKTDVQTSYLDPDGTPRPLSSLTFSVKAGSNKVSQSSGTTVIGVRAMYKMLGLSDAQADAAIESSGFLEKAGNEDENQSEARVEAIKKIFATAVGEVHSDLAKEGDKSEKTFLVNFFKQIKNGITGGASMIMVDFNANGTYNKFNPHVISNLVDHVDLEAKLGTKGRPTITIYDQNSQSNLLQIRLEVQSGGRLTFHVELDKNFKTLASTVGKPQKITDPEDTLPTDVAATITANLPATKKPQGAKVKSEPTAGIQNLNKTFGQKIPMGAEPETATP
jgi:hypothetical protein